MSENRKTTLAPGLFATPFSREYWSLAAKELKNTRMLIIAALLIAVRVAIKSIGIPLGPTLKINFGLFVNALGAGIFGPVVAILAAAISDTLGCLLFPEGVYFFPFIFTEIAGSVIFALFLYRAPRSGVRIALSRFAVCFLVNIVIQTPIMMWYYKLFMGKAYAVFDLPRICKNLVLFPLESILLILFLDVIDPITYKLGLTYEPPESKKITKKVIALLVVLFLIGSAATAAFMVNDFNTRNHATDFETEERAAFNRELAAEVGAGEDKLVLVNTIYRKVGSDTQEVTYSVYAIDPTATYDRAELEGMKNTAAAKLEYLTFEEKLTVTLPK